MTWFKHHWASEPNSNLRFNGLVIDLTGGERKQFPDTLNCAVDAVHEIVRRYPPPYVLYASGGIDSQAMIYAWYKSGVDFQVVTVSYNNNMNYHDIQYLFKYCSRLGIEVEICDFDAINFIKSPELITYAREYDCSSPQILTHIKMIESQPGTIIMSGNTFNGKNIGLNYTLLALDRYRIKTKSNLEPFFLASTPSITFLNSYCKTRYQFDISRNNPIADEGFLQNWYAQKTHIYNSMGAQVIPQKSRYTGFEKIKEIFDTLPVPINLKYKYRNKPSKRPFDVFYRYKVMDEIGLYSEENYCIV